VTQLAFAIVTNLSLTIFMRGNAWLTKRAQSA
jgi:hypothetical protein